ncbi:putative membrane protein [Sphingobium sp. B2D3A]|uniref:NnrU family protein n=1 Tax=unclassified Sphingobium TaxID=2611147 RepID=UPI0022258F8E|nr:MULTISPECIES: NnrU family protein [unclassified Sphingobium]MCW2336461.1 putative membrane protein [Sphingobium sp. B2D3A]MCW2386215.1 putative membrane protein [Sphingobium sp. B2D3D]
MQALIHLALAMGSFVGTHLLLSHPLRAPLVARLGERGFLGLYTLTAFATLGWTILAFRAAPAAPLLWMAPIGLWHLGGLVMALAGVMLVGSLICNAAMVDPTGQMTAPERARGVYAVTRHPMMWSFILWALVHATLWPSGRTLILSGGVALLACVGALGQDRKKARLLGAPWRQWQARTSFVPFVPLLSGKAEWHALWPGVVPVLGGVILWLGATWAHPLLGGPFVPPWLWIG